jgi:hypothetical protein
MKLTVMLSLLLLSTTIFAREIELATVRSDIESDIIKIVVDTDEQNELTFLYTDTYKNGSFFERKSHNLSSIDSGFVIYRKSGRDVVILNRDDFATYAGGTIKMKYLYSGISGTYHSKTFVIEQTEDSWRMSKSGRTITGLFFKAKKTWGKVVGIKDIVFKY